MRRVLSSSRALFAARTRSEWWTKLLARAAVHQDVSLTWVDRYPRLFSAAQAVFGDRIAQRVLSFGCSSGEEVVTLRHYFPTATVIGAEINRTQLAACRRLPPDPQAIFIASERTIIAAHGPYDAIFCMAVLQRRPHSVERDGITDISRLYPFKRFEDQVLFLAAQLRPGGLLVADHCHYRIEDVAGAALETVPGAGNYLAKGARFNRAGQIIVPQPVVGRIFRKRGVA